MHVLTRAFLLVALFCAGMSEYASAQPRVRKSIDRLTAAELMDYLHAVKKLREKSATDPTVQYSYAHMAGMHNRPSIFNGACEHWNHKFLAWHRALLINYEDALRAIDPTRTANVTIPYWNWAEKPSGKRYPVAFENDIPAITAKYGQPIPADLLKELFKSNRNMAAEGPLYPWQEISAIAIAPDTVVFAGTPNTHGALENPPHDTLHGFMGGDLVSTSTAANDAIFWSYHSFIDLVWWWRQSRITETPVCLDCPMRGMPIKTALGTQLNTSAPQPPLLRHVMDAGKLNYTYEFKPEVPEMAAVASAPQTFSKRFPNLAAKALTKPDYLWSFSSTIPATASGTILVTLRDVVEAKKFAYIAFVYIHPANVEFKEMDAGFRDKYLVGHYSQWVNSASDHGGAHAADRQFNLKVERAAYSAFDGPAAAEVKIVVAVHIQATDPSTPAPAPAMAAADPQGSVRSDTRVGSAVLSGSQ